MTRIDVLNEMKGKLKNELAEVTKKRESIAFDRADALNQVYEKYFLETLETGDSFRVSDSRLEFCRPEEGRKFDKEILTLYFKNDWETKEVTEIETSFYSTTDNSEFELRRMILIGKVAEVIIDFKDDILAEVNHTRSDFEKDYSDTSSEIWKIEKEISKVNDQISDIEKENLLSKLFNGGVKFSIPEDGRLRKLPTLQARWDWSVDKITSIKVTRKTTSGKSFDVEGTFAIERWDDESKKSYITESTFECNSVRADKVESMLSLNSELIKE